MTLPATSSLYSSIVSRFPVAPQASATFLLGTDRHIGEEHLPPSGVIKPEDDPRETRVAITPSHVGALRDWLSSAGVNLRTYVVSGAGLQAGYRDTDYEDAGASIIAEERIATLQHAPDVVHALKEPTEYESRVPGTFIRIGALHLGDFHAGAGLAHMMKRGNFSSVIDGSYMGGTAYRLRGGFDVPLRKTMSDFAGDIGADEFVGGAMERDTDHKHHVIVVGGGVAGQAAVRRLLRSYRKYVGQIQLVEQVSAVQQALRDQFGHEPLVRIVSGAKVTDADLRGVTALVIATFRASAKDFVAPLAALKGMRRGGVVVDISCDEGPSIEVAGVEKLDGEPARELVRSAVAALGVNLSYEADTHLPRKRPREASEAHGRTVFPYLATLLHLCAASGGAQGATQAILSHAHPEQSHDIFSALVADLKRGLVLSRSGPVNSFHLNLDAKTERAFNSFAVQNSIDLRWPK